MIFRWLLAFIYLAAGLPKILNPVLFKATIAAYFPVPDILALVVAIVFPWLEIIAALSLLLNWKTVYSSGFLFLLSLLFLVMMVLNYSNILPYGCGCFGFGGPEEIGIYQIVRDSLISILAGIVFVKALKERRITFAPAGEKKD